MTGPTLSLTPRAQENKNNATAILIKEWNELKKSKRRKSKGKGKKAATASASPAGQTRVARPPTSNPVKVRAFASLGVISAIQSHRRENLS